MGLTLKSRPRNKISHQSSARIFVNKNFGNKLKWRRLNRNPVKFYAGIGLRSAKGRHVQYLKPFQRRWRESKALNSFYGNLRQHTVRQLLKKSLSGRDAFKGGNTKINNIIILLERRLDVILFRSGLCRTIFEARQIISHGKVKVDNVKQKYGSRALEPGSLITLNDPTNKGSKKPISENHAALTCPSYLTVSFSSKSFVFSYVPVTDEILFPFEIKPKALFEFYRM